MINNVFAMALCLASVSAVNASTAVHSGTIYRLDGAPAGDPNGNITQSSLDILELTVLSPGSLTLDILSYEAGYDFLFNPILSDVNNDGEIAYLDTKVMLIQNDGDLTSDDIIAENDDDPNFYIDDPLDGSFCYQDSYLHLDNLAAGNYLIAIGNASIEMNDVVRGFQNDGTGPLTTNLQAWIGDEEFIHDHGDYQLTVSGSADFTAVPEPSTCMLISFASMLALSRRRRRA